MRIFAHLAKPIDEPSRPERTVMTTIEVETDARGSVPDARLVQALGTAGVGVLRYGLVFLLLHLAPLNRLATCRT
jgi:hypothetical protein